MKESIDGGTALLEAFRACRADYIFCCSGSEWAPVWEAIARDRLHGRAGPRYLDLWHETVAVGMATGYALVTGRAQPVLLHAGPGLLQGSCAVHGALLAGAPMLVFSSESITYGERAGQDPGSQWYRNLSIVGGPHALVPNVFKWSCQAPSIETLYEMTLRATEMAMRTPTGPCYLNVPVEVLFDPWTAPATPHPIAPAGGKVTPSAEIAQLAERLRRARNPLLLTESAGRDPQAWRALVTLCDLLAIPVVEPQGAVSANFPRSHALHLGSNVEAAGGDVDLVLLVNCRAPWYPPSARPAGATTVVIDEVPQRPHIVYQVLFADQYLEGDVADTLQRLAEVLGRAELPQALIAERRARHAASHARQLAAIGAAEAKSAAATKSIDAVRLLAELRALAPADSIYVDETITHARLVQQHLRLDEPGRYYYVQGGLGQGIAVALGVKLAERDRPVVLTVGDGSFLYNPVLPSLAAARNLDLPLLIVIFNNRQYLSMKYNHLRIYPDSVAAATGMHLGVDLSGQPDLAACAAAFGMFGTTVSEPAQLRGALQAGLDAVAGGRSAIVNVLLEK